MAGTSATPFLYLGAVGYYADRESLLYAVRARSFDPSRGRFLSRDQSDLFDQPTNLYTYVVNNPANISDPSGLQPGAPRNPQQRPINPRIRFRDCLKRALNQDYNEEVLRAYNVLKVNGCATPFLNVLTNCTSAHGWLFKGGTSLPKGPKCQTTITICLDNIDLSGSCAEVQQVYLHELAQAVNVCLNCKNRYFSIAANCPGATSCPTCHCMEVQALRFSNGCEFGGQFNLPRYGLDPEPGTRPSEWEFDTVDDCLIATASRACVQARLCPPGTLLTSNNLQKCKTYGFPGASAS